jgi:hypothetical protein
VPRPDWPEALDGLRRELTGTIETLDALDPEFPGLDMARAGEEGGILAPPDGTRGLRAPLGRRIGRRPFNADRDQAAADGVNEVLDTWLPAGRRKGPGDMHGVVHLVATDASYEWFVRLRGAGVRCSTPARSWTPTITTRAPGRPEPPATCCWC